MFAVCYDTVIDVVLKVMCWGVRNMRKFQLSSVVSPNVEIEIGGQILRSKVIKNAARNPNFDDPMLFFDIVSIYSQFAYQLRLLWGEYYYSTGVYSFNSLYLFVNLILLPKFKWFTWSDHTPSGMICHGPWASTTTINLPTKFEVSMSAHYKNMKRNTNVENVVVWDS